MKINFIIFGSYVMKYLLIIFIIIFSYNAFAEEKNKGFSTLPGWSAGYRYYFDLDDHDDDKLRLFGKFKLVSSVS